MVQTRISNEMTLKEKFIVAENFIDGLSSNYTDWYYIENILEDLQDRGMLSRKGIKFRNFIWKKHIRELEE